MENDRLYMITKNTVFMELAQVNESVLMYLLVYVYPMEQHSENG